MTAKKIRIPSNCCSPSSSSRCTNHFARRNEQPQNEDPNQDDARERDGHHGQNSSHYADY